MAEFPGAPPPSPSTVDLLDSKGIEPGQPIAGAPRVSQAVLAAERSVLHPLPVALGATLAYVAIAAFFAWLTHGAPTPRSDHVAGDAALELLQRIGFWVSTGLLFFGAVFFLARRANRAAGRLLRRRDELIDLERRAIAGVLAASVAHDANNLLMVVFAELEGLGGQSDLDAPARQGVQRLRHAASELAALYQRLRTVTRQATDHPFQSLDLGRLVEAAVSLSRYHPSVRSGTVRVCCEASPSLRLEPTLFRQMLVNLIVNAGQAAGEGGVVEIRVAREAGEAVLEVHDNGPGVAPEVATTLFEPFVSTKADGSGLGLLSVKAFADVHAGRLVVRRSGLGGACFEVRLPLHCPEHRTARAQGRSGSTGSMPPASEPQIGPGPSLRPMPPLIAEPPLAPC